METVDGLKKEEDMVMNDLLNAWSNFKKLPKQHPDDLPDFKFGIHLCQGLLMQRVTRRDYPKGYYNQLNKKE